MTTLIFNNRKCRICSEQSSYEEISSTNQFGSVDLDLRPPEMMRSTMRFWVQKCTHCEYTYETVDNGQLSRSEFEKLKYSSKWQNISAFVSDLQLCEKFVKYALILELEHRPPIMIAQQFLRAAWAADDEVNDSVAREMRSEASSYLDKALDDNISADELNNRNFVLLDIFRRSGRFDDCGTMITQLKNEKLDSTLTGLLSLQALLIADHDIKAHKLNEIYSTP